MGQSASDIRAGGSFVELYAKDGITGVLGRVKKRFTEFVSGLSSIGTKLGIVGGTMFAPLAALFKGGTDRGAELARLSTQLGLPIEKLNALQYAAEAAHVSLDEVGNDTSGRYSHLIARAPGIDPAEAKAAAEVQLQLHDATLAFQSALTPLVKTVAIYATKFAEFAKGHKDVLPVLFGVGAGMLFLAAAIKIGVLAYGALATVAPIAWAAATGPIGLGVGAGLILGSGLFLGIAYLVDEFNLLKQAGSGLGEFLGTVFGGIADALKKGDIETAWQIVVKSLEVTWRNFVWAATAGWIAFKTPFVDTWIKIVAIAKTVWADFIGWFTKQMALGIDSVIRLGAGIARAIHADSIAATFEGALGKIPGIDAIDKFTDARKDDIRKKMEDDLEKRKKARLDEAKGPHDAMMKAEAELAKLRAEAAKAAPALATNFGDNSPLQQQFLGSISAKGGFSSSALNQSFGISDDAKKQTEYLKAIMDGGGGLPAAIGVAVGKNVGAPAVK